MERKLYAVCPRCGKLAEIEKYVWDWENEQDIARIRCRCGRSQMPYLESRVLKIDLLDPFLRDNEHFDLLVPPDWNEEKWDRVMQSIPRW